MEIRTYLYFDGRCDEAIDFYKRAVGAKVQMLIRFKECPEPPPGGFAPAMLDKVMHASLGIGNSRVFVSDGHCTGKPMFAGFCVSLTVASDAEVDRHFNALADGGKIGVPLAKTFFSSRFGMLSDRFGVNWMVLTRP